MSSKSLPMWSSCSSRSSECSGPQNEMESMLAFVIGPIPAHTACLGPVEVVAVERRVGAGCSLEIGRFQSSLFCGTKGEGDSQDEAGA
eukprot:7317607-Prymnesium_polylepis.2